MHNLQQLRRIWSLPKSLSSFILLFTNILFPKVKLIDSSTKEETIFIFNRWLSRELDDGDMVRELPVSSPGKEPLKSEYMVVSLRRAI